MAWNKRPWYSRPGKKAGKARGKKVGVNLEGAGQDPIPTPESCSCLPKYGHSILPCAAARAASYRDLYE